MQPLWQQPNHIFRLSTWRRWHVMAVPCHQWQQSSCKERCLSRKHNLAASVKYLKWMWIFRYGVNTSPSDLLGFADRSLFAFPAPQSLWHNMSCSQRRYTQTSIWIRISKEILSIVQEVLSTFHFQLLINQLFSSDWIDKPWHWISTAHLGGWFWPSGPSSDLNTLLEVSD